MRVSEITLTYRSKVKAKDRPQIKGSRDAYEVLKTHWSDLIEFQEEFNILLLNRENKVIGFYNVSKGSNSGTIVDAKIIFTAALKGNANSIILAHNHPSGNLQPSRNDIEVTKKLKDAGKLLDIEVLDHIILSYEGLYYSFADGNMI